MYSTQTKEDLQAKLDEFDVVEKENMKIDKISHLSQVEVQKLKENLIKDRTALLDIKFEYIGSGFHSGPITELHTCLQRPVLLTCSVADQTLRLWNYITSSCDLIKSFSKTQG